MGRLISDRMSYRNHYMCSGEATIIKYTIYDYNQITSIDIHEIDNINNIHKISLHTVAIQYFWYHFRTAGLIWLKSKSYLGFSQSEPYLGFPHGNKGVFQTTGNPGRIVFLRIMVTPWVP